jgi:hypothetical protein
MALFQSNQSKAARPAPSVSQAGQSVSIRGHFALTAALALNDVLKLVKWPANTVIDELVFDFDTVDSNAGPAAILQVGVLNAAGTAIAGTVLLATTAAQSKAGGGLIPTTPDAYRSVPSSVDRYIGVLVQTGPATGVAPVAVTLNRGAWAASTVYAAADYVTLPNGQIMKVTTAGTSGASAPEWNTVKAATTSDGTAVWTAASSVLGITLTYRNQNFGS